MLGFSGLRAGSVAVRADKGSTFAKAAQPFRAVLQLESFDRCSKTGVCYNDPSMGIKYPAGIGILLLCDYARGGFQPPEMVKRRPAIVISPRLPHRDGLCTVVPVSS